jgi:hypothetical protein
MDISCPSSVVRCEKEINQLTTGHGLNLKIHLNLEKTLCWEANDFSYPGQLDDLAQNTLDFFLGRSNESEPDIVVVIAAVVVSYPHVTVYHLHKSLYQAGRDLGCAKGARVP